MTTPKTMTLKTFEKKCMTTELENKYHPKFSKEARSLGNGVYCWHDIKSSDTRELFLLGVAARENIMIK